MANDAAALVLLLHVRGAYAITWGALHFAIDFWEPGPSSQRQYAEHAVSVALGDVEKEIA